MNSFVNAATNSVTKSKKDARTANGAVTRSTSGQAHLDLFAIIGSARNSLADAMKLFSKAYADDKELALRIALWARDVRGGAGERAVFRAILADMVKNDPVVVEKLIPHVAEFGRWDDVIDVIPTSSYLFKRVATILKKAIEGGDNLAAKWTPRKGDVAVALRNEWNMSPKQYRKYIVSHTNVVETLMCNKEWSAIEFDKLPSLAGLRYQAAFAKNAPTLYEQYKAKLVKGEAKINVSTLFPHNIVANVRSYNADQTVLNAQWKALPNYLGDRANKVMVMSDVSGSMGVDIGGSVTAMDVSIALGLYTAERLTGPYKDLVLTFSGSPTFHKVTGNTLSERYRNLSRAHWEMNTDLQKAVQLILTTANQNKVSKSDMPETLVVISDMEFDACTGGKTNFGAIKKSYENAGYKMPQIVFWNVNGRAGNNPVKYNADGACMVSGFSPAILQTVLTGEDFDPMKIMFDTVGKSRYDVAAKVVK